MPDELGLNSLYKVLKDETRKKVILALHDKGSLTYSDLMATVQVESTGKFNYHLKVLNGLISKTEDGKYILSEKGREKRLIGFSAISRKLGVSLVSPKKDSKRSQLLQD